MLSHNLAHSSNSVNTGYSAIQYAMQEVCKTVAELHNTSMIVSQVPLQTPAHGALSLHWCTYELSCTSLSWCGPVWELSGCLMTAKAAIQPQWALSLQQWSPGMLFRVMSS